MNESLNENCGQNLTIASIDVRKRIEQKGKLAYFLSPLCFYIEYSIANWSFEELL